VRKTSVYLTDDEADSLRRVSKATGKSQAELVRDGIRHVTGMEGATPRRFHSLGKGRGGGTPYAPWNADDLYAQVMGRE
jgi:hypothetical protein